MTLRGWLAIVGSVFLLSACASAPERHILVESHSSARPAPEQSPAYRRWQAQPRLHKFYMDLPDQAARAPVLTPPSRGGEPQPACDLIQSGLASWYGPELAGNKTANGEMFDPDGITAAHPKLPFGTILKVTLDNERGNPEGVYVRVNDRGPFVHGRIIDLSLGAAKRLGMKDTQPVHVYRCS